MTRTEYNMLVQQINDMDLKSGKVLKANGQWYIEGKKSEVPRPVIKLPHWTEGTKRVVIDGQVKEQAGVQLAPTTRLF